MLAERNPVEFTNQWNGSGIFNYAICLSHSAESLIRVAECPISSNNKRPCIKLYLHFSL